MNMAISESDAGMNRNSLQAELSVSSAPTQVPTDAGCIAKEELAEWPKLVEGEIPKVSSRLPRYANPRGRCRRGSQSPNRGEASGKRKGQ